MARTRKDEPEEKETQGPSTSTGEYVVTVGGQPVFSSKDKEACEAKAQVLRQDKIRANESIELPEHQVKIGQVHFEHRDDRTGKIRYEDEQQENEETKEEE